MCPSWQAPLGDIERGQDLHARDHRGDRPRRRLRLVQHAVDAVGTMSRFSNGSMWMSEARDSSALARMRFTRRMTGASEARSFRCSTSPSHPHRRAPDSSTIAPMDDCCRRGAERRRSRWARRCTGARACPRPSGPRRSRTNRWDRRWRSRARPRPAQRHRLRIAQELRRQAPSSSGSSGKSAAVASGRSSWSASASARSRPDTIPRRSRITPIFSRVSPSCNFRARSRFAGSSLARPMRISPIR